MNDLRILTFLRGKSTFIVCGQIKIPSLWKIGGIWWLIPEAYVEPSQTSTAMELFCENYFRKQGPL